MFLRPEPRPARKSPTTTPDQGFRKPSPQLCPVLHATLLHTKHQPCGPSSCPLTIHALAYLKALTHAVPSAWNAPLCILHMAGSSHSSGLSLNATSSERPSLLPNQRAASHSFPCIPFAGIHSCVFTCLLLVTPSGQDSMKKGILPLGQHLVHLAHSRCSMHNY